MSVGLFPRPGSKAKPKTRRGHGGPTPARKRKAKPSGRAGAAGRGGVRR